MYLFGYLYINIFLIFTVFPNIGNTMNYLREQLNMYHPGSGYASYRVLYFATLNATAV